MGITVDLSQQLCENAAFADPFKQLDALPERALARLQVDDQLARQVAQICLMCPTLEICQVQADGWQDGAEMDLFYTPDIATIVGAYLLNNSNGERKITLIPTETASTQPECILAEPEIDEVEAATEPLPLALETTPETTTDVKAEPSVKSVITKPAPKKPSKAPRNPRSIPKTPPQQSENHPRMDRANHRGFNTDSFTVYKDQSKDMGLLTKEDEVRLAQLIEAGVAAEAELQKLQKLANEQEIPFVKTAEILQLQRSIRRGKEAHNTFVESNLRLVVSVAKRFRDKGLEFPDLVQEGNLGLMHAVDKFDWQKGFKFSTYATFWIRQAIGRALNQKGSMVRIPDDKSRKVRMVNALVKSLPPGTHLTVNEIAQETGLDPNEVSVILAFPRVTHSLSQPITATSDTRLEEIVANPNEISVEETIMHDEDMSNLYELVNRLEEPFQTTVRLRFGLDDGKHRSYADIGKHFGVSGEIARRRIKVANQMLLKLADENHLA